MRSQKFLDGVDERRPDIGMSPEQDEQQEQKKDYDDRSKPISFAHAQKRPRFLKCRHRSLCPYVRNAMERRSPY